jgi:hypothetical protein
VVAALMVLVPGVLTATVAAAVPVHHMRPASEAHHEVEQPCKEQESAKAFHRVCLLCRIAYLRRSVNRRPIA